MAMNDSWFDLYVAVRLTRSLLYGDVIVRDKGLRFMSLTAFAAMMCVGEGMLFLLYRYGPDRNGGCRA